VQICRPSGSDARATRRFPEKRLEGEQKVRDIERCRRPSELADVVGPFPPLCGVIRKGFFNGRNDGVVRWRDRSGVCFRDVAGVSFLLPGDHMVHDDRASGTHCFLDGCAAGFANDDVIRAEQPRQFVAPRDRFKFLSHRSPDLVHRRL